MKKRFLSILLSLCMVLSALPAISFADGSEEPTESPDCTCETACADGAMNDDCPVCGAESAVAEDCAKYTAPAEPAVCICETACADGAMNDDCPVCGADGAVAEDCAKYTAPAEPAVCTCETACADGAMNNDCPVCGVEGAVAEDCAKYVSPSVLKVARVQEMLDALPDADEVTADDYDAVQEAYDAYEALDPSEQEDIVGVEKFEALFNFFNAQLSTLEGESSHYGGDHCLCGGTKAVDHDSHSTLNFIEWTDELAREQYSSSNRNASNSLPKNSGSYYLTKDITSGYNGDSLEVDDNQIITICLNGHEILAPESNFTTIKVKRGTLNITDCHPEESWGGIRSDYVTITAPNIGDYTNVGNINLYGGKVISTATQYGDATVSLGDSRHSFTMYNGEIVSAREAAIHGGTLRVFGGKTTGVRGIYNNSLTVATVVGGSPNVEVVVSQDCKVAVSSEYPLTENAKITLSPKTPLIGDNLLLCSDVIENAAGLNLTKYFFPSDTGNYELLLTSDGKLALANLSNKDASVTVGGTTTEYANLSEALAAAVANEGSTLKLLRSKRLNDSFVINSGKFTLDMNDRTLSLYSAYTPVIINGGEITIEKCGISNTGRGSALVINGGTVDISHGNISSGGAATALVVAEDAEVTLKDCNVANFGTGVAVDNDGGKLGIENGTLSSNSSDATIKLSDGETALKGCTVKNNGETGEGLKASGGSLAVDSGTFDSILLSDGLTAGNILTQKAAFKNIGSDDNYSDTHLKNVKVEQYCFWITQQLPKRYKLGTKSNNQINVHLTSTDDGFASGTDRLDDQWYSVDSAGAIVELEIKGYNTTDYQYIGSIAYGGNSAGPLIQVKQSLVDKYIYDICKYNGYYMFTTRCLVHNRDEISVTVGDITATYSGASLSADIINDSCSATVGGTAVEGTWSWVGSAPKYVSDSTSNGKTWKVCFTPTQTDNYLPVDATAVNVTINPKNITIKADSALHAVDREYIKGDNTVTILGGTLDGVCEGDVVTLERGTGTMTDDEVGTGESVATDITLSGKDKANYNLTGVPEVTVNILKRNLTKTSDSYDSAVVTLTSASFTYDGTNHSPTSVTVKVDGETLTAGTDYTYDAIVPQINAGTYTVTVRATEGSTHYRGQITAEWKILPKDIASPTIVVNGGPFTYDGTAKTPTVTVKDGDDNVIDTNQYSVAYSNNGSVGTATVAITGVENGNYTFSGTTTQNFTIGKGTASATVTGKTGLVYNGKEQKLVEEDDVVGGEVVYSTAKDGTYTAGIPTAINANETGYTYYYYVKGDSNHNDTAKNSFTVKIGKRNIADTALEEDVVIELDAYDYTFDTTAHDPSVTSVTVDGRTLDPESDYTAVANSKRNAGSYSKVINGTGNYTGTASKTWKISPKTVTATVTVNEGQSLTYTGRAISPEVTVKDGTTTIDAIEYEVSYSDNVDAGTATVNVADKSGGNYTVSGSVEFTVAGAAITDVDIRQTGELTYNAELQTATIEKRATTVNGQTAVFTYATAYEGPYSTTFPQFSEAGMHLVYYKVSAPNHNDSEGSFWIEIKYAPITITAADKRIKVNTPAPDLSAPVMGTDYTVEGYMEADADAIAAMQVTLSYDNTLDTSKRGEYPIIVGLSGIEDAPSILALDEQETEQSEVIHYRNYAVTLENGTLTVYRVSSGYAYFGVNAIAGDFGSITPAGKTWVRYGRTLSYSIIPDEGYVVENVKVDGKSIGAVSSYIFEDIREDHTIEATFKASTYNPKTGARA